MLKGKDIIIVCQQAWDDDIGSNCRDIALQLAKANRVLYVNPPLDRITKMRFHKHPKVKKRLSLVKKDQIGLYNPVESLWVYYPDVVIESINWIPFHFLFRILNRYNNKLFAQSIEKALKALSFDSYVLFNDSDMFRSFHLKELLKPVVSAYYSRDNLTAMGYWHRHGRWMEPRLIVKSDYCFANSDFLTSYCKKYNEQSYYVGQGCDFSFMKENLSGKIPLDISTIKHPIVGYVGALTTARLDLKLLEFLATEAPHLNIVLIGPEDESFKKSSIHDNENVFFLGKKRPEDLPDYIDAFDVCINPQILNDMTKGNYPRKVDEYLTLGKPVVATYTDAMIRFNRFVHLAHNRFEFLALIENILNEPEDLTLIDDRVQFALSHSWEKSVDKMGEYIHERYMRPK